MFDKIAKVAIVPKIAVDINVGVESNGKM